MLLSRIRWISLVDPAFATQAAGRGLPFHPASESSMLFVAIKRLWTRPLLTLLSIAGVTLAIGLVAGIPLFAQAVSFLMLKGELGEVSARSGRPPFSMRVYVLPGTQYPLSLDRSRIMEEHISETITSEAGLPLVARRRQMETTGLVLYTRKQPSPYGEEQTLLRQDLYFLVLPGVASHIDVMQGEPMDGGIPSNGALDVWLHVKVAQEMGIEPGETFEVRDQRQTSLPVRVAGIWQATDPHDRFWFSNPDLALQNRLLVREVDYETHAQPLFREQLGFVSWYLILDDGSLAPERMRAYAEGLSRAFRIIDKFVPGSRVDGSPLEALNRAIERERNLTALLIVFSVPLVGFLLYFLALISTITLRWQRRETAIMVSRGMRERQLLAVGTIEATIVVGIGCALGLALGVQVAQLMGYARSFLSFTRREPLPVSPTAFSLPLIAAIVVATFVARIWPLVRSARTGVVSYERRRARAPEKPLWQRFYLDVALLVPVLYAYRQLSQRGTLVPQLLAAEQDAEASAGWLITRSPQFVRELVELLQSLQDPLLFLVPALLALTCSLLLVRLFPLWMRLGDWLGGLGREATFYLAFRQLARQSNQYTSALLLVITSLSLGAFMASMAASLDRWLIDRVQYAVGSDVYIRQLPDPSVENIEDLSPSQGAWVLPISDYLDVPGVTHAARVGMYPVTVSLDDRRFQRGTFIGVDRLDVPEVVYYRADFGPYGLGELMNRLAPREDGVLLSEKAAAQGNYEVGDKVHMRLSLWFDLMSLETDFTVVGTFKYFPTVYEDRDGDVAVIGNLDFVFEQIGAVLIHDIWLRVQPDADRKEMMAAVANMGVYVHRWVDVREEIAREQAKVERVGTFGTLTIGFLAAAVLSGVGLLVYNYASLQERLFRFTILRAVGLALVQVVGQITIEYVILMVYSVLGGAAIGVLASRLFIPFFQATDQNVLNPPMLLPLVAWEDIGRISAVFIVVLIVAQIAVVNAALRRGVFQALRMGDRE
jgi:putative ABC transport system permease protein